MSNGAIRVGLSTSTIEPTLTHGRLDGIGVYTNALLQGLSSPAVAADIAQVQGFSFPHLSFRQGAAAAQFTVGRPMPYSFVLSSVIDSLTPKAIKHRMPVLADVVHVTDYRIIRMNCPIVATLHDAIPLQYPEWCSPRLRQQKNWLQKKAAQKADHVIALSHFSVLELVKFFGINQQRITVVPCGVADEWLQAPAQDAVEATLAQHGLQPGYFLFVGTLQPRKNIERILMAYLGLPAEIRAVRQLVIVGRAGWQCDLLIKKILAAQQCGEHVVWLNSLSSGEQLRHVYKAAGVFVFPSLHEGFGIPVTEAFASGVPVVTSNTTSLPEVSAGAAIEVSPLAINEIGTAMLDLVRDEQLRARCIAAGLQRASQLSWRHTIEKTIDVYRSVL